MADSFSQTVKQQADIVRILGEYVRLRKSGANWNALCPFHKERSGSFYVYPGTASYYCFGCHEHGDVFSFVMKMESVGFPEAVRTVAQKMGIALPKREWNSPEEAREAQLRRQLLEVYEAATQYFQGNLHSPEAAHAREYMSHRGLTPEAIKTFRLGYAPGSWDDMRLRMQKFFPEELLRVSGLFGKPADDGSPGKMYPQFQKRIIFPICNEAGKPIAFTGRLLDSKDPKAGGKYLNSPDTPLYTKSHVLFNLDKAKAVIREQNSALLVEGQMDCLSVYMSGLHGVLATSGTAFSEHQVRLLGRFTKNVVVNFDGDEAGLQAAVKTLEPLVEDGFQVRVVVLPGGADPDSFIREHALDEYIRLVRGAVPWTEFLIDRARTQSGSRTPEERVKALNFLLPHFRRIPNSIVRTQVAEDAAQKLGIESSMVLKEVRQAAEHRLDSVRTPAQPQAVTEVERILLCALVLPEADSARALAAEKLRDNPHWFEDLPTAGLIEVLIAGPPPEDPFTAAPDAASRALLASALHVSTEVSGPEHVISASEVASAIDALRERHLERRGRELRAQMSEAQRRGDDRMLLQLAQEKLKLDRERKS